MAGAFQLNAFQPSAFQTTAYVPIVQYVCRIAFVSNPFASSPTWVDVSDDLMSFHIRRGRQWELNRMEAGTATVRLRNLSGNYWPNNTGGTYYPNVLPWKRINIRATYAGTTYDLYTGFIESWQPTFVLLPIKAPVMDLSCSDGIKNLSRFNLNTTGYAAELSGTRVSNVLTSLGWPTTARNIGTGQSTMQSTGALVNVNAMTHLFSVSDSELGILYMTPSGSMTFQDRHTRLQPPYTVSVGTFGDAISTGDMGYTSINLAYEDLRIYNDLRVTRTGGTEQTATDTTSALGYGPRTLERPSLLMTSDADALAQAQYLLARYKNPALRCKSIEIRANATASSEYPQALGNDVSTRVTIRLTQASIAKDYHIEGIYQDWDVTDAAGLKTTWMLSDANSQASWTWDSSVWDGPDIWGY